MTSVSFTGIGNVPVNPGEYTSTKLLEEYNRLMNKINVLFNKAPEAMTVQDYKDLQDAVNQLKSLAVNGDKTTIGGPFFMPKDMILKLDNVFSLLKQVGITPDAKISPQEGLSYMKTLKNWETTGPNGTKITFSIVVGDALKGLEGSDLTLQSMLFSIFLKQGNDDFEKQMAALEKLVGITPDISNALAKLIEFKTKHFVKPGSAVDPGGNISNPVSPTEPTFTEGDLKDLYQYRQDIKKLLERLKAEGITPDDEGSIASTLNAVLKDLDAIFPTVDSYMQRHNLKWENFDNWSAYDKESFVFRSTAGARNWVIDGYNTTSAGAIQNNLEKALNGATSLTTTNKAKLQKIMLVYDQYMKIAIPMLSALSKTIEKFAQGVSR